MLEESNKYKIVILFNQCLIFLIKEWFWVSGIGYRIQKLHKFYNKTLEWMMNLFGKCWNDISYVLLHYSSSLFFLIQSSTDLMSLLISSGSWEGRALSNGQNTAALGICVISRIMVSTQCNIFNKFSINYSYWTQIYTYTYQ